ncbi:MAG TPA: MBL fold metallo-hydrolase, partial [Gammaproteobacteria bacterium]|nr:MBL fold metallo-hydrolase [Gammaproteobacteria bacterium]
MKKHYPCIIALLISVTALCACTPEADPEQLTGKLTDADVAEKTVATETDKPAFPYAFEKVANHTWVMHGPLELPNANNKGFMNNPGLIKTSAGLVIIDPGSTLHVGRHVLSQVKTISELPVVAVFNTHKHGDHWLGNQAIREAYPEVTIYGHPNMRAAIAAGEGDEWLTRMESMTEGASTGTKVVAPDTDTDNTDNIRVGDTTFKIHHFGIAHTNGDIMIEVEENSVIFLGDNVLAKRLPRMSDGTFQGTMDTINTILKNDAKTWVPGHGPTGDRAMVREYLGYVSLVYAAAKQAFEDDLDSSDVITITRKTTAAY